MSGWREGDLGCEVEGWDGMSSDWADAVERNDGMDDENCHTRVECGQEFS